MHEINRSNKHDLVRKILVETETRKRKVVWFGAQKRWEDWHGLLVMFAQADENAPWGQSFDCGQGTMVGLPVKCLGHTTSASCSSPLACSPPM